MNPAIMAGIFLFARIWDGINDPMMGIIADRSKSRFGALPLLASAYAAGGCGMPCTELYRT